MNEEYVSTSVGYLKSLREELIAAGCEVGTTPSEILTVAIWYTEHTREEARKKATAKPSDATLVATALAIQAGTTIEHVVRKAREMQEMLNK